MRCIIDKGTNAQWNLAADEFLFKHLGCIPVLRLWQNAKSIIIGRYQNTLAEINTKFVEDNNIMVVRRMTGGGAVFHDLGNLNYSFVAPRSNGEDVFSIFEKFTKPAIDSLNKLGVKAYLQGRNDILIDGRKCSGNALAVYKDRILMHGTLLFSADLSQMAGSLRAKMPIKGESQEQNFSGKAVASRVSRTCNISEFLKEPMTIEQFILFMAQNMTNGAEIGDWSDQERSVIDHIYQEKYSTYEWNYGKSPAYSFNKKERYKSGTIEIFLNVENATIKEIKIFGDYFSLKDTEDVERLLCGTQHSRESIRQALSSIDFDSYFNGIPQDEFVELFF